MDIFTYVFLMLVFPLSIWGIYEFSFWKTHQRPLTEQEIHALADARRAVYINQHFQFTHSHVGVNPAYRSSLNRDGRWDRVDIPLGDTLSLLTQLLRYKRHEWFVLCLADENKCKLIWANKGDDNSSCYLKNSFAIAYAMANQDDCHTIIVMHNHPHTQERWWNLLSPSGTDLKSYKEWEQTFTKAGYNIIDALCTQGEFTVYGYAFSPLYCPPGASTKEIALENGKDNKRNYKLHMELRKIKRTKINHIK